MAARRGRPVRFLIDWMFVDLPWTGWLLRRFAPIPVYAKPARFRLRERHRRERRRDSAFDAAVAALGEGQDVGLYPEGRRNPDPWLLGAPRRGLARLALRAGAPVVPIGIDFPARDRLQRTPRAGRLVLRVGEPLSFGAEHAAWRDAPSGGERRRVEKRLGPEIADRVHEELARLARKVYVRRSRPEKEATVAGAAIESGLSVAKVLDPAMREAALGVIAEVYGEEKRWLADAAPEIPVDPTADSRVSWFLARSAGEPVGVVRLSYDPPLELPRDFEVEIDSGIDLERLAAGGRFVEVGRLMIRSSWRSRPAAVLALMRSALAEVVGRGYTHLFTAVFEDDPHSPYRFHTRQLGFERVGTHRHGELECESRRILLVLDLARAWRRLRARRAAVVGHLARGLEERLEGLAVASS